MATYTSKTGAGGGGTAGTAYIGLPKGKLGTTTKGDTGMVAKKTDAPGGAQKVNVLKGAGSAPVKLSTTQPAVGSGSVPNPNPTPLPAGGIAGSYAQGNLPGAVPAAQQAAATQQGNGGAYNTNGVTDPFTGFASRYDPRFTQQLYDNPNLVYQDVIRSMGLAPNNTILAESGNYAQNLRDLAGLLSLAGAPGGGSQSEEALINTWANLMQNGMGPGGDAVDYRGALGTLFHPGSSTNALSEYLFGAPGDTSFGLNDQANALSNLFGASIANVNPYTQQSMASAFKGAQTQAQNDLAHGATNQPRLLNYLRNNLAGVVPGL